MVKKIEIKHRLTGEVIFEFEKENNTVKDTVLEAIKRGINLCCAVLTNADLSYTDLSNVNLSGADLYGADLYCANLCNVTLYYANLFGADLCCANLRDAKLHNVNLTYANLSKVDLYNADLRVSDFYRTNLFDAKLRGANLCYADLTCDAISHNAGKIEDWMSYDNIGSINGRTLFFKTDKGIFVQCDYFFGNLENFVAKVKETHNGNEHERNYLSLIEHIKVRFEI